MADSDSKKEITLFAKTNFRNKEVPFGIKIDDRRRHMYIIGKTGMGKTTLMENMIIQDIISGRGLAFVDPHGDSVEKILNFIPNSRVNDVVYINPADQDFPIAFNVLESVDPRYKHLAASGLMGVFTKIWADTWSARMEYILNNAILALLDSPGNTLLGIARMLIDKKYRKKIVDNVKDPIVKSFWVDEFANWNEKYRGEAIAPIQNKVGQFLSSSIIRNIIGQPKSTIDLREIMDGKKILLLNLSKGRLGEDNAALLGAMIITKLQLAALSRVDISESEREDFYLFVDEFQNFATKSFATILSEARKYRLNLIVGHQYIGQLVQDKNTEVRDAVFGNVGSMVCFRVGATDAEFLEKEFFPTFVQEDLVNLPKHTIILRLMINGVASDPFTANTLPPSTYQSTGNMEKVIRISRERYANTAADVEDKITRWMGQDYHEQVAVIAGGIRTEQDQQEAPLSRTGEPESEAPAAIAADVSEPEPQQAEVEIRAPKIEAKAQARTEQMAAEIYQPESVIEPAIEPEPRIEQHRAQHQPQQAPRQQSQPQQRRSSDRPFGRKPNNNRRKENPIWDKVANMTEQKTKSNFDQNLNKTFSKNRHPQAPKPQPTAPAPQSLRPEQHKTHAHTTEQINEPAPSAPSNTPSENSSRVVLKPGESSKING